MSSLTLMVLGTLAMLIATTPAAAAIIGNGTIITVEGPGFERTDVTELSTIEALDGSAYAYSGSLTGPDVDDDGSADWVISWSFATDGDPFIAGVVTATNNSNSAQDYFFSVNTPFANALPSTVVQGSIGVTASDGNNNGGFLDHYAGNPLNAVYTALLDGSTYATLLPPNPGSPPFPPMTFPAIGSNTISNAFGPSVGPAVNTDMTVEIQFQLSARDLASSTFNLVVTPEPSSIQLAGLAVAGVVGMLYRRRKQS
jgi:hypothetical protein